MSAINLNHQLASAALERDSFKAQIDRSAPNDGLRMTGPAILAQLNAKVRNLEAELREQDRKSR